MQDPRQEKESQPPTVNEAAVKYGGSVVSGERPVRKNHYLYQSKIDMAKEILGTATETDAIDGALDLLIYGHALARGTEEMAGEEYDDVLGIGGEVPDAEEGG